MNDCSSLKEIQNRNLNCNNFCKGSCLDLNLTISKQDLNKDWLRDNCETRRCTPCEDLSCKNQKCDLYTCGDYEVGVE